MEPLAMMGRATKEGERRLRRQIIRGKNNPLDCSSWVRDAKSRPANLIEF